MKEILFSSLISIFSLISFSQKTIEYPRYAGSTASNVNILKIELLDTATVLNFMVTGQANSNISIPKASNIQPSTGGEQLFVQKAEGIELAKWTPIPESGEITYRLFFKKLNDTTEMIDFGEGSEGSWFIYNIELIPQKYFSIIPESTQGNWYRTDGSNEWIYGFYDNMVVFDKECWNKILINNKGKNYQISIQNDNGQEVFYIKLVKKDKLLIGNNTDNMELFSREKTDNPDYIIRNDEEYTLPVFKKDKAIYKGFIRGYLPKMGETGMAYVNDILSLEQNSYLIPIEPDGSFYAEFPMIHPQGVFIKLLGTYKEIFLEPGKTTFHFINLSGNDDHFKGQENLYMGDCARINSDLQSISFINFFNYYQIQQKILDMSATQYKEYCLDIMKKELDALKEYSSNNLISKKAFQIKQMQIHFRTYANILSYNMYKESEYRRINEIPREQREIPIVREKLDPDYYDFISAAELNNPVSLVSGGEYNILINRIRFADCIWPPASNFIYIALLDTIKQKGISLSTDEYRMLEKLSACETGDCIKTIQQKEDTAVWRLVYKKYGELIRLISKSFTVQDMIDPGLKRYFGLDGGFAREIMFAQSKCGIIKSTQKPFTEEDEKEIRSKISDRFIVDYLISVSKAKEDEINAKLEANKNKTGYVINETPKTESDKLFDAITQKYKGKVVLVDFWATWCGPCLSGIEKIKPLKEELKDKDIEFVYITNYTSPIDTWNMMIPDIKGEHYRVKEDEWNFLASKFNISGIPHYVLVDKAGNVVEQNIFFASSNEELKNLFEKYLWK